jgi:hypothetical protein
MLWLFPAENWVQPFDHRTGFTCIYAALPLQVRYAPPDIQAGP